MPRPKRCRYIDAYPEFWSFSAEREEQGKAEEEIRLSLDEFESIRLIDYQRMTQEQCAEKMGVARTTVTAIYESARGKLAECLVEGKTLRIGGGEYRLHPQGAENVTEKGENILRVAVTYEAGEVFQHFGHTEQIKLYDIEDGEIKESQVISTNGHGHGALAGFLKECGADVLICGGIGMGARNALAEAEIKLCAGVQGDADQAAREFAEDSLAYSEDANCDHHGHHGQGHECGHHTCGHQGGSCH